LFLYSHPGQKAIHAKVGALIAELHRNILGFSLQGILNMPFLDIEQVFSSNILIHVYIFI
jgi:hypothetical protein